jgi:type II protein arginine methyltransferase
MTETTDPDWRALAAEIDALPIAERPARLIALARQLLAARKPNEAGLQAFRAHRLATAQSADAAAMTARALLADLLPGYHIQVPTDPVRAAAWEAAFVAVVKPGMRALEIGAGSGILAMLAARAGARVTSCESSRAIAAIAEEIVAANGFAGSVRIVAKPVGELAIPGDLDAPAALLFYDTFSDNLFGFEPFALARQARALLTPDAVIVPRAAALHGALGLFVTPPRRDAGIVAGLDLSAMAVLAPVATSFDSASPAMRYRSDPQPMVEAELPGTMPERGGEVVRSFTSTGGTINGVALWLRLELVPGVVLEARPGAHSSGFYAKPKFHHFGREIETRPGDRFTVRLAWHGKRAVATLAEIARAA